MKLFSFSDSQRAAFNGLVSDVSAWCAEHQVETGLVEMAVGASLIHYSVANGVLVVGQHIVASAFDTGPSEGALIGGATGISLGLLAGKVVGAMGVAAMGTGVGVPAGLVMLGGSLILGAAGYTSGDVVYRYVNAVDYGKFAIDSGVLVLGVALLLDGARRVASDAEVQAMTSRFVDGVCELGALVTPVIAKSYSELTSAFEKLIEPPSSVSDGLGSLGATLAVGAGGVAAGSALAASSVTVAGSQALGAIALSLGLVSAPVWPVILAGVAGAGIGYAGWKAGRSAFGPVR
jgi:hypothetical protein